MQLKLSDIPEINVIYPCIFKDNRGSFSETYNKIRYETMGVSVNFIQDNRSISSSMFTVRGLHFQVPPFAQSKLVSVQRGSVLDVAVDLRRSSPTFGQHVAVKLTADGGEQIFIPAGFAHGFCTLEPDTIVTYKVDQYYSPAHESGLYWRTAELGIEWPCGANEGLLSPKDMLLPAQIDRASCFV